jgi:hypothetical protein
MSIDMEGDLYFFEISGGHYDLGFRLGQFGARAVHEHLTKTRAWATIAAMCEDARILEMARKCEHRFPQYFAELAGLSAGLELPFGEVFAWNCRGDLWAMVPDGCTTVQLPGRRRIIAHNEDGDPGFRGYCALVHAAPSGEAAFTSFIYPGSLPGHTFAATDVGLVQTVNNIRAIEVGDGLPRMMLTRAMLNCRSVDAAVDLLRTSERAGAFHVTLTRIDDPRILSVEFGTGVCSAREIAGPGVHANHLIHEATASIRQVVTHSSASRQSRADLLISENRAELDPLAILRDKSGPGLPIRRDDPKDPDDENTLATAVFIVEDENLDFLVYDRGEEPPRFHFHEGLIRTA